MKQDATLVYEGISKMKDISFKTNYYPFHQSHSLEFNSCTSLVAHNLVVDEFCFTLHFCLN